MRLLSVGTNAKTIKSDKEGVYLTAILYLAPHTQVGTGHNLCPMATRGCAEACLYTAGRGRFTNTQAARIKKSRWFIEDRVSFMNQLALDIKALVRKCDRLGVKPCVRLNGTSDIPWERVGVQGHANLMEMFPNVQFYDYTKILKRQPPSNYHLTFSLAENNDLEALEAIKRGYNVAVVFRTAEYPNTFMGLPVVDGDKTDLRFTDPDGVIVGLKAKGAARQDTTGFVRRRFDKEAQTND